MTIRFACPKCRFVLEAREDEIGEKLNCPKCNQRLQVPARCLPLAYTPPRLCPLPLHRQGLACPLPTRRRLRHRW